MHTILPKSAKLKETILWRDAIRNGDRKKQETSEYGYGKERRKDRDFSIRHGHGLLSKGERDNTVWLGFGWQATTLELGGMMTLYEYELSVRRVFWAVMRSPRQIASVLWRNLTLKAFIGVAIAIAIFLLLLSFRYKNLSSGNQIVYMDQWTGTVYRCREYGRYGQCLPME